MSKNNYYLYRDRLSGEMLYLEYYKKGKNKVNGYGVKPKVNVVDAINVTKIVFINPGLREKLIKKKIDIKIRQLLKQLEIIDEDGGNAGDIKKSIIDAETLKIMIINTYCKYLGNTYSSLSIKKIQMIINKLRVKLYSSINYYQDDNLYYLDDEEKRGRGR